MQFLLIIVMLSILSFTDGYTQEITGNLSGQILSETETPLSDAEITVEGRHLQGMRGTVTDNNGKFHILALPVGKVTVKINHLAYQTQTMENVIIRLGKTTSLGTLQLLPQTIEGSEVTITETKAAIDPFTTTIGENINAEAFETLPTERDYIAITSLLPQANTSYLGDDVNIAGSTGQENAYFIDGVNTTDPYLAIGGTRLPYNFVREIEVKSGGYEAEFGRATGGIVNVITYSGGNEVHGQAFGFFTSGNLAADGRRGLVELGTGDFARYDAGISLGGPIVKDKLWYYLAYNSRVEQEDLTFDGLGIQSDKNIANIFAGKLTWQPANQTNVILSVFGDPSNWDRVGSNWVGGNAPVALENPDPFLGKWKQGGINFSLKGTHVFKNNLLLEANVSQYKADFVAEAATEIGRREPEFHDNITAVWSGGYGSEFDRKNTRRAASISGTWFRGLHSLKAGFQFEDNIFDENWTWLSEGPDSAGFIIKSAETRYLTLPLDVQTEVRNRVASLFAQGTFAASSRLRINAGIRWDGQYFKGLDTGFSGQITDQFQPRLGVIYQPGKIGSQKISASFGRFYEQIPNLVLSLFYGSLKQSVFAYDHNPLDDPSGGIEIPIAVPGNRVVEPDLVGEHYDEFTLGYEQEISGKFRVGAKGIYRTIREIIQNFDDPETGAAQNILGNPGRGIGTFMPAPQRDYTALELTFEKFGGRHFNFFASYVLSRNYGNYTGLFSSDTKIALPNAGPQYDDPIQLIDATGLLPNDRTHVFKFNGSYRFDFGLVMGTSFLWQRGTPLSEYGAHPVKPPGPFNYSFLRQRGTLGRMPTIWDWNIRMAYDLSNAFQISSFQSKLILDVFHIFSQKEAVDFDQTHYFAYDQETGEQIGENPTYLEPLLFQPPMTIRLGLEVGF